MTFYDVGRFVCAIPLRTLYRLRVSGLENVPPTGPVIVAANHVSYLDPPILGVALRRPLRYMAKSELFDIPVIGPVISRLGAFPVDRSRGDVSAIRRSIDILRGGSALAIFPEGTRNRDGTIEPHEGAALLASLTGVTVVPAGIAGSEHAGRLQQIAVRFGAPLAFAHAPGGSKQARRAELSNWTDEIMAAVAALRERT